jgi:hypothetical protein
VEFRVEDDPDPLDIEFLETQIRREASAAMGLGDEVELAIFVRDAGAIVAGISGWTWGGTLMSPSSSGVPETRLTWAEPVKGAIIRVAAHAAARRYSRMRPPSSS